jgi:hypothetical protein
MEDRLDISRISWGDEAAENDGKLLNYFVLQDDFIRVLNLQKSIVIGRKGVGKSALFKKLRSENIKLADKDNSKHIVSDIRQTFNVLTESNLTNQVYHNQTAFQLSWVIYIYKKILIHIGDTNSGIFQSAAIKEAREFALENRIAVPTILETFGDLVRSTKLKPKFGVGELEIAIEKASKKDFNFDSMESHLIKIGAEGFKYLLLVDDLDQGWNNSDFANNFLLGLFLAIDYIKSTIENFSSIIFIRDDIYHILMQKTSNSDKYRNYYEIQWNQEQIIKILNERIKFAHLEQGVNYPGPTQALIKVFPHDIGNKLFVNWIYELTFGRPRDIIQLARLYSERNINNVPDQEIFLKAVEPEYSNWKIADLASEHLYQYEKLGDFLYVLGKHLKGSSYNIFKDKFSAILTQVLIDIVPMNIRWINELADQGKEEKLMSILYDLYVIGDKVSKTEVSYKNNSRHKPSFQIITIHPAFRSALSVSKRSRK